MVIAPLVLISKLKFRFGEGTVCPVSVPGAAGTRDRLFQLRLYLHQYGSILFPFCVLYQARSFPSTHGQWEWPIGYYLIREPISLSPLYYCIYETDVIYCTIYSPLYPNDHVDSSPLYCVD